ncbi:hypothetical protein BDA96_09G117800 [Sorghum bicolor]|uniref:Secreted protein n=1 Tax=Sorghum bicolor TaxID=4558 RepID=A0A921QCB1_SORBI|nr:hypothetical protein BDA96_09G117800 [Sorghum bicolor]
MFLVLFGFGVVPFQFGTRFGTHVPYFRERVVLFRFAAIYVQADHIQAGRHQEHVLDVGAATSTPVLHNDTADGRETDLWIGNSQVPDSNMKPVVVF